jgi:hypothetical protein
MIIPLGLYPHFAPFLLGVGNEHVYLPHYTEIQCLYCSKVLKEFFYFISEFSELLEIKQDISDIKILNGELWHFLQILQSTYK